MILCITGMHRSGTSLTAAWLQSCGLTLADREMLGPNPDNPKGFYEDVEFFHFHRQCIIERDPGSYGWKIYPDQPLHFSDTEIEQARRLVAAREARYATWGWKDPRTSLFLPAWKALLPELKVLVVWRPCDQVLWSLLRRWRRAQQRHYHTGLSGAIRLWQVHNRLACAYAEAHPRDTLVLTAQQIVRDGASALALINARFGTTLKTVPVDTVYEAPLLHWESAPQPLPWICAAAGCHTLEKRLQSLTEETE